MEEITSLSTRNDLPPTRWTYALCDGSEVTHEEDRTDDSAPGDHVKPDRLAGIVGRLAREEAAELEAEIMRLCPVGVDPRQTLEIVSHAPSRGGDGRLWYPKREVRLKR